jgi:hypothetical protein
LFMYAKLRAGFRIFAWDEGMEPLLVRMYP